jgi:fluoride exporter
MKTALLIFAGGGLGSVARYFLGRWVSTFHQLNFPFGTLAVNVVACFVLGLVVGLSDQRQILSPDSRVFWAIGFCGGFSTFSTFSYESLQLFQQQATVSGLLYIIVSVALCLLAVVGGMMVGR